MNTSFLDESFQSRRHCRPAWVELLQDLKSIDHGLTSEVVIRNHVDLVTTLRHRPDQFYDLPDFPPGIKIIVARIPSGILFEPVLIIAAMQAHVSNSRSHPSRGLNRVSDDRLINIAKSNATSP